MNEPRCDCGHLFEICNSPNCECGPVMIHATPSRERCLDGQPHDWGGWREITCEGGGGGGETVCKRCGIGAMEHSLRYGA